MFSNNDNNATTREARAMRQSEVHDQFQKEKKQEYQDKKQAKIISVNDQPEVDYPHNIVPNRQNACFIDCIFNIISRSVMPYIPEPPRIDDNPRAQLFANFWKAFHTKAEVYKISAPIKNELKAWITEDTQKSNKIRTKRAMFCINDENFVEEDLGDWRLVNLGGLLEESIMDCKVSLDDSLLIQCQIVEYAKFIIVRSSSHPTSAHPIRIHIRKFGFGWVFTDADADADGCIIQSDDVVIRKIQSNSSNFLDLNFLK
ncbi:hypothetical protein BDC45DRAFT_605394 [Circinella umbellata]|nr:hypothetical protein BDC45DRAFT_605394 [Circinella umbellata]